VKQKSSGKKKAFYDEVDCERGSGVVCSTKVTIRTIRRCVTSPEIDEGMGDGGTFGDIGEENWGGGRPSAHKAVRRKKGNPWLALKEAYTN